MKKSIKFLAALLIPVMFASCAKEEFAPMQENAQNEFVGAKLIGTNVSIDFAKPSNTKLYNGVWQPGDQLGLAWAVTGAYNSNQDNNPATTLSQELYANHMFEKVEGGNFTTKGNVYEGWHFAYYPFEYMKNLGGKKAIEINPTQTQTWDKDVWNSSLYVSAREFLTEGHLTDDYQLDDEKVVYEMYRALNTIVVFANPDAKFVASNNLKNLPITGITIQAGTNDVFYTGNATVIPTELPQMQADAEGVYSSELTATAMNTKLAAAIAAGSRRSEITTVVDNETINLSAEQGLRIYNKPQAGKTIYPEKVKILVEIAGGLGNFLVEYADEVALDRELTEAEVKNNAALTAFADAYKTGGVMSKYDVAGTQGVLMLDIELTPEDYTPDFSNIKSIIEWNQAVGIANDLGFVNPEFTIINDITIDGTVPFELPNGGVIVNTGAKAIKVATNYEIPAALIAGMDAADRIEVTATGNMTVNSGLTLNATVINNGNIVVEPGATVKGNVTNNKRIEVYYGAKLANLTNNGKVAYAVLPANEETAVRINEMIANVFVNTLVINKDVELDMTMTTTTVVDGGYYGSGSETVTPLESLAAKYIEMNGGSLKGDDLLTKSVKNIEVLSGVNTVVDVLVNEDIDVKAGAELTVDATPYYNNLKRDITVTGDLVNAGKVIANVTMNVTNVVNATGNTLVNEGYTIWYTAEYTQGGKAEGLILKKLSGASSVATATNLSELTAALANPEIATVNVTNANILSGTIDLKGKTISVATVGIASNVKISNGTITSQLRVLNGVAAEFKNVNFVVDGLGANDYVLQPQGSGKLTVDVCTFNSTGRAIETVGGHSADVVVKNSIFLNKLGGNYPTFNTPGTGKVTISGCNFQVGVCCEFQNNLTAFTIENNNFVNLDFTQSGATLHSSVLAFIEGVKAANNTFSEGFFGWGPSGKVSY